MSCYIMYYMLYQVLRRREDPQVEGGARHYIYIYIYILCLFVFIINDTYIYIHLYNIICIYT